MDRIAALQRMKRDGRRIVAVVVYDYQMAQIADRAGVDIVSAGDSVGVQMWGQPSDRDLTVDQMLVVCRAVRRGVGRALMSCDMPYGPLQEGPPAAVRVARRLVEQGGADLVKLDAAAECLDAVRAVAAAGVPVWAQFGITPHASSTPGADFVRQARLLEQAGAALLDFTHSGPDAGPAVTAAVTIPVLGGLGGGPWLDGRIRAVGNAIGYTAAALDDGVDRYANVARTALDALTAYAADVRTGRQIRGG